MKQLEYTHQFKKLYKSLNQVIQKKVDKALLLLLQDYRHPSLRARKMMNRENIWEARVDYHYRVTFMILADRIILTAVGTHEIYRNN